MKLTDGKQAFLGGFEYLVEATVKLSVPAMNVPSMRKNFPRRASARPMVVLPVPGGPYRRTPCFERRPSSFVRASFSSRESNVNLEAPDDVVDTVKILQVDLLDFSQVDITGEALRPEIFDEDLRNQIGAIQEPSAGSLKLMRVELGAKRKTLSKSMAAACSSESQTRARAA